MCEHAHMIENLDRDSWKTSQEASDGYTDRSSYRLRKFGWVERQNWFATLFSLCYAFMTPNPVRYKHV